MVNKKPSSTRDDRDDLIRRQRDDIARLRAELERRERAGKGQQRQIDSMQREIDGLKRENDHLKQQLAAAHRAGRRQAAPFAKDRPQGRGGRPGRRAGARYGRHGCRPRPAQVDETHSAPVPAACPDCGGAVASSHVASQYQEELPKIAPIVRHFEVEVGFCTQCQRRVQGRHRLRTSDALGAAGAQLGPNVAMLAATVNFPFVATENCTPWWLVGLGLAIHAVDVVNREGAGPGCTDGRRGCC